MGQVFRYYLPVSMMVSPFFGAKPSSCSQARRCLRVDLDTLPVEKVHPAVDPDTLPVNKVHPMIDPDSLPVERMHPAVDPGLAAGQ